MMIDLSLLTSFCSPDCLWLSMISPACSKDTENVALRKQQYGSNKTENEVIIVIEAYRTLRDWRPYSTDQVVRDISRKFGFVLFDSSSKTAFQASDVDGSVPFFWGIDSGGNLVLLDDAEIVKMAVENLSHHSLKDAASPALEV